MSVENLIDHLKNGDNVKANKEFDSVFSQKVSYSFEANKIDFSYTLIMRN